MIPFEELSCPRAGHGLQAMMRRWEQLHPVNAVHVVQLNRPVSSQAIRHAADRVFERLLKSPSENQPPRSIGISEQLGPLFDFSETWTSVDELPLLESAVTAELNTPFAEHQTPFRLRVIRSRHHAPLLLVCYRHVVADARALALLIQELLTRLAQPDACLTENLALISDRTLPDLYPQEFRLSRSLVTAFHILDEWWQSRHCLRLPVRDPDDLHMDFQIHHTALPLEALQSTCHKFHASVNDLLLATLFEWFSQRIGTGNQCHPLPMALATLADLSSRGTKHERLAFGQFVSQFAIRAVISPQWPFSRIVATVQALTQRQKQTARLIDNSRGFDFLSRLWDWWPSIRSPGRLAHDLPFLAGISNVNLAAIWDRAGSPPLVRSYLRGTCVTNLLPMMLTVTSTSQDVSLSTTHRSAYFTRHEMSLLASHVCERLIGAKVLPQREHNSAERIAA
ncbi:MAG: hypothetical protein JSS02_33625 [Planctomycetes bacterium]|nr:hypothetical protein [Planctomycetota bacterium]